MNSNQIEFIECRIDDIATIHNSKRIPLNSREREKKNGPYPYYGASGVVDYLDNYIFDGEYVLISEDGENLRSRNTPIAFKATGKFWVNNHAHIVQGKEEFINDFIIYYFSNLELNPFVTGAVQPKLNKENLLSIPIFIPKNKNDRIKTIEILKSLDHKIELNQQINKTLEEIATAIFKEWFVDFNFPNSIGKFQETEIGKIPVGWKKGSIEDLLFHSKDSVNPLKQVDVNFIHYSIPAYDEGNNPSIEKGSTILSNKYQVKSNSILVSKLNPRFPRTWAIGEIEEERSICSTEFQVLVPRKPFYYSYCLWLFAQTFVIDKMKGNASGTSGSHQRVRPQDILDIEIALPTDEVLKLHHVTVSAISKQIDFNKKENQTLINLRDTLLPKLMKGEIEV